MWHRLEGIGWEWLGVGALHMALWSILILICLGILIWLIRKPSRASVLEILQMRYARGELNSEQFQQMKRELVDHD